MWDYEVDDVEFEDDYLIGDELDEDSNEFDPNFNEKNMAHRLGIIHLSSQ